MPGVAGGRFLGRCSSSFGLTADHSRGSFCPAGVHGGWAFLCPRLCLHRGVKLALHRSVTFWSGVVVMVFICWAWRDSLSNLSEVVHEIGAIQSVPDGVLVSHGTNEGSGLKLQHEPHRSFVLEVRRQRLPRPFFLRGKNQPLDDGQGAGKPALTQEAWLRNWISGNPPRVWMLFIPYWVISLFAAIVWTGLLLWRARRRKQASTSPLP